MKGAKSATLDWNISSLLRRPKALMLSREPTPLRFGEIVEFIYKPIVRLEYSDAVRKFRLDVAIVVDSIPNTKDVTRGLP